MTETTKDTEGKTLHKPKRGEVVALSGDKTLSVDINSPRKHKLYKKYIQKRTRLAVHDERNEAKVGDVVEIISTRPLSKRKAHRLLRVVRSAKVV